MRQVHLIMPFMRGENKDTLIRAYKPMNIILHPIMFAREAAKISFNEPWIFPVIIPQAFENGPKGMEIQNIKRNYFIRNCEIVDDDYYVAVDDDDMYESNVFNEIKKMNDDIVIISMRRGHSIPKKVIDDRKYPTDTLYAEPNSVVVGAISNQQSFVKGSVFKKYLYDADGHCADGRLAVKRKESGEQIAYRRDLFALFNYYEPGRWKKEDVAVSFGVLVNDLMRLDMVFRQSAIEGAAHIIKMPETATKGLNKLLELMEDDRADIGVLAHQDMFFRKGWVDQMKDRVKALPDSWVVAGIIGKDMEGAICGRIHDMRIPLHFSTSHTFPEQASCFDECCILVNLKKGFRFDEGLPGFDLYGTLCVLQAKEMGGTAWIIDAFAEHYCMRPFTWYPGKDFEDCYKWIYKRFPNADRIDTTVMGVEKKNKAA